MHKVHVSGAGLVSQVCASLYGSINGSFHRVWGVVVVVPVVQGTAVWNAMPKTLNPKP